MISNPVKPGDPKARFKSPKHRLMANLGINSNWMQRTLGHYLKPFDLSTQQFNILRILRGRLPEPASVQELGERMVDKMSNASRLVERLRKKDLVCRKICPDDRRAVEVTITEKGLELLQQFDSIEPQMMDSMCQLNQNEIDSLNNLLEKMRFGNYGSE